MLVLSRRTREAVLVGGGGGLLRVLTITVLEVSGGKVQLGFEVDADIPVHRREIWERLLARGALRRPDAEPNAPLAGDQAVAASLPPAGMRAQSAGAMFRSNERLATGEGDCHGNHLGNALGVGRRRRRPHGDAGP